jgi:hypothetical protein
VSDPGSDSWLPQFITGYPGYGPEFGTAGLASDKLPPGYDGINNTDPQVAAQHASQICTLGTETLDQGTAPGDPVALSTMRVRCTRYRPSF